MLASIRLYVNDSKTLLNVAIKEISNISFYHSFNVLLFVKLLLSSQTFKERFLQLS